MNCCTGYSKKYSEKMRTQPAVIRELSPEKSKPWGPSKSREDHNWLDLSMKGRGLVTFSLAIMSGFGNSNLVILCFCMSCLEMGS